MSNLIEILHSVSNKLTDISEEQQIYQIMNDGIKQILPDSYFIITKLQSDDMNFRIIHSFGFDKYFPTIKKLIGKDPYQMDFPFSDLSEDEQKQFKSRKLYHLLGGIYDVTHGRVNKTIAKTIEKLLGISEVYAISFCIGEKQFGGSTFLIKKSSTEQGKLSNDMILTIETLAAQASFAINKLRDLEALTKNKNKLSIANKELGKSVSLLNATLESTVDGIIVVDNGPKGLTYNNKFLELWRIPKSVIATQDDEQLLSSILAQLSAPDDFLVKVREMYLSVSESFGIINFKDGRIYERYSQAQILDGKSVGRVWSFRDITERKTAEIALKESDERWRTVVGDNPNLAVQGYDKTGKTIYWNKGSEAFYGYSSDEAMGVNLTDLIIPEEMKSYVISANKEMFANQVPIPASELKLKRKDGSLIDVFSNHSYFQVPSCEPEMYCLDIDITGLKQAEAELLNAEEKYRIITQASLDIIFILDKKGKMVFGNQSMIPVLGYETDEFMGKSFTQFVPQKELPKYFKKLAEAFRYKEVKNFNTQIYHKDGHLVDVEINGKLIQHEGKLAAQGTIRDISQRKQAEQALKESEERWRFALEGSGDGLWDWNLETNEVLFSNQWKAMLGFGKNEISSQLEEWSERVHPDDLQKCYADVQLHLDGKVPFYSNVHRVLCKDGTYKWILDRGKITKYDNNGKALRMIGTHSDLTERMIMENQLRELNATKDKFFSIIAHDLKNPFNAILGFSNILLDNHKKYDDEKRDKMITIVRDSANSAYQLLENLLTWSRSQSGRIEYAPQELYLKILLFETISALQAQANRKGIQILDTVSEKDIIYADKNMVATVFRNLVSNAIKFTNKNGTIVISSQKQKDSNFIEISVTDTGVGIPENIIDDLFRIDKNITTSGTENETGTGLGLILCKEFVEKHGGKIWVESTEGKGSDFKFTMPLTQ